MRDVPLDTTRRRLEHVLEFLEQSSESVVRVDVVNPYGVERFDPRHAKQCSRARRLDDHERQVLVLSLVADIDVALPERRELLIHRTPRSSEQAINAGSPS